MTLDDLLHECEPDPGARVFVSVARNEHPDLVLLDIGLPAGDGLTVLERYAKLPDVRTIPVVVLTGRDPAVTEPAVRAHHVAGFLRKPVDNYVLLQTIRAGAPTP